MPIESERLRCELPTLRDQVLWGLMACASPRPEEALAFRWRDIGTTLHIHRAYTQGEQKETVRAALEGVIPYNGRDTFASLLIYEDRPPILVAAALGHGDTQTLWDAR